jgi:hypothetical protein
MPLKRELGYTPDSSQTLEGTGIIYNTDGGVFVVAVYHGVVHGAPPCPGLPGDESMHHPRTLPPFMLPDPAFSAVRGLLAGEVL